MKINSLLVKLCGISNAKASEFIEANRVLVNKRKALQKEFLSPSDLVELDGKILREPIIYKYYAFYKPRGIECTLNPAIENNLRKLIPFSGHFYPVGRLDKESEGLLLITNDGNLYQQIALSENLKEKEYEVKLNSIISDEALLQLTLGVLILRVKKTRPCKVSRIDSNSFRIILTQGLNRQIRRMCHTLGLEVISLKRTRISSVKIDTLKPGEYRELMPHDI